jgi:hypothetical protein
LAEVLVSKEAEKFKIPAVIVRPSIGKACNYSISFILIIFESSFERNERADRRIS